MNLLVNIFVEIIHNETDCLLSYKVSFVKFIIAYDAKHRNSAISNGLSPLFFVNFVQIPHQTP